MRRVAHPYHLWEDYRAGMYATSASPAAHVELAYTLLADPAELHAAMAAAVSGWPTAAEHNLTAIDKNRQAWLGAAACFYVAQSPEHTTRAAWWQLTTGQQRAANDTADRIIAEWEQARAGVAPLFILPRPTMRGDRCA